MSHLSELQSLVSELRIKVNAPAEKHMGLDYCFGRIVEALSDDSNRQEDGSYLYRYKAKWRDTDNFRLLRLPQPKPVPDRAFFISDTGINSRTGVIEIVIVNSYRFKAAPKMRYDREIGLMYEVTSPKDFEGL